MLPARIIKFQLPECLLTFKGFTSLGFFLKISSGVQVHRGFLEGLPIYISPQHKYGLLSVVFHNSGSRSTFLWQLCHYSLLLSSTVTILLRPSVHTTVFISPKQLRNGQDVSHRYPEVLGLQLYHHSPSDLF